MGVFVPASIVSQDPNIWYKAAECRFDGRGPILSYVHKKSANAIWRSSEIIYRAMAQGQNGPISDDVKLMQFLQVSKGKQADLVVYSSRDAQMTEEKQYGYESLKTHKNIQIHFYGLSSKFKLLRSFE